MSGMRIAFVCGEYPPGPHGGIGTVVQLLARALVRRGHEVRVVGVCRPDYPGAAREDDEGVAVSRLHEPRHRFGWMPARRRLLETLADWGRRGAIDVVEVPDYAGVAAGWPRLPVPVVARVHGSVSYFAAELGQRVGRRMFWLERASLRRADAWCAVSRYAASRTARLFGLADAASVVYNAVELPVDATAGDPPRARASRDVVFSGTLTAKKGVEALAAAWPLVLRDCPDATLHVCGKDAPAADGRSMRARLEERLGAAAPTVRFHGHVARGELLARLQAARAAVFPSYAEAFAMAPLEAMACGTPTVYPRRGSGAEVIDDGRTGLLVDPDRTAELAGALVRLLRDDDLAGRLGAAGRAHVGARFGMDVVVRENEAFYERALHDARRARAS